MENSPEEIEGGELEKTTRDTTADTTEETTGEITERKHRRNDR